MKKIIILLMSVCLLSSFSFGFGSFGLYEKAVPGEITPGNYAGSVIVSTLIGFGIGNYMEGNTLAGASFLSVDIAIGSLALFFYLKSVTQLSDRESYNIVFNQNAGGQRERSFILYRNMTYSFTLIYAVTRVIELLLTIAEPLMRDGVKSNRTFVGGGWMTDRENYRESRKNYFAKRAPSLINGDKGGVGVGYSREI